MHQNNRLVMIVISMIVLRMIQRIKTNRNLFNNNNNNINNNNNNNINKNRVSIINLFIIK
jgi:hypothetical protein